MRFGERAWGVQFHPEFDGEIVRGYIEARRELIANEGIDLESAALRGRARSPRSSCAALRASLPPNEPARASDIRPRLSSKHVRHEAHESELFAESGAPGNADVLEQR